MYGLRQEIVPPSGVEYATSLKLTSPTSQNIVVARSSLLTIYELRTEPAPLPSHAEEREREATGSRARRGTEAVEGEVQMDTQGEGFVNVGTVKPAPNVVAATVTRLYFIREHRLHGIVTGLARVQTMATAEDGLDRLLLSFKDAKIALVEWSDVQHDISTVSIHTYERAPQVMNGDPSTFKAELRVDPASRCAALLIPKDSAAILPFYQTQADLDLMDHAESGASRDVPYSPSYVLQFSEIDDRIRNVIDFVFLPGFNNPTIAILFQTQQTWTGRLKEYKDTVQLFLITLNVVTRDYPIITMVENLPYDCSTLLPCPTTIGGVVVVTPNSILHVDQAGRIVGIPFNGWARRVSDINMDQGEEDIILSLEGSRVTFVDEKTLLILTKEGHIYPIELEGQGRTVSRFILSKPLARTTIPSVLHMIDEKFLFVGCTVGPSVLLKADRVQQISRPPTTPLSSSPKKEMEMDIDDEDLYGDSATTSLPLTNHLDTGKLVLQLSHCDTLPAHGSISAMTFSLARNGDRPVPELIACTGTEHLGGFTLFQRDLPTRTKRKLHAIAGSRGMWSFPLRQEVKVNGMRIEKPSSLLAEHDTVIVSTDATPSPGLSRIAARSARNDIAISSRIPIVTIAANSFFSRTCIVQVTTNSLRLLTSDGTEKQVIKDMDGNMTRPKIRSASICDPFVLILREDDTLGLFVGEAARSKIRRKDMSPMGEKPSRYLAASFFMDNTGTFEAFKTDIWLARQAGRATGTEDADDRNATSTLESTVDTSRGSQWLILCRPQGIIEIWTLPKLTIVFSSSIVTLPPVISDTYQVAALSLPEDPPRKLTELDIDSVIMTPIGQTSPRPHLVVLMKGGQAAVYETVPSPMVPSEQVPALRTNLIPLQFFKIASRAFDASIIEDVEMATPPTILDLKRTAGRTLVPFLTSPAPGTYFSGVFITGERPAWLIATDKSGPKFYPCGHNVVHAFTACSVWESHGDFLIHSDEGPSLIEWMPNLQLHGDLPCRSILRGRAYSHISFDTSTQFILAASSLETRFVLFDDDGNKVWEPDAPNIGDPYTECSTLELISPDGWVTVDGFEFPTNEFVTALESVNLETLSTENGNKDFIAVGTTVYRGEDLAVRGATYIFEVVDVVPDPISPGKRKHKLRLHCRDDAKAAVTAICEMNGYLVSSMGQKIFVRAFDLDERLVGVAFMDVGVYVTSLKSVKNLLLIGDALKSVRFVAFQEDPFKLVTLSQDIHPLALTHANFFFGDGQLSIVTTDEEGVIRIHDYNPLHPDSGNGQKLLCQTEFHGQTDCRSVLTISRRIRVEDVAAAHSKLIAGTGDGSLTGLLPVDEVTFKRLQLLQGQLSRNVQHIAGLNPKAFRIVRNDYVSRPLSKGILDGVLLAGFETLPVNRQVEITKQIGTDRTAVLRDLIGLSGSW